MTEKQQNEGVGFALRKISLDQFAVLKEAYQEGEKVHYDVSLDFGLNTELKMFRVSSRISFAQLPPQPFLLIEGSAEFAIEPDAWERFILEGESAVVFPHGFVAHLAALTVGSLRGMLYIKTQDTIFNRFLIPTINVAEIVGEDIRFDFAVPGESV
ncbi:hypothetical protein [Prosthecochloris sp. CIB 2401]|uniref:hypothetical protein n=1 Tax=Prosthecochloris sp. CIB 2401 TaxID=1868325 RepID=UPI00080AAF2E|nr:hypothetical protein [Prosthecochloris sp. CIB 2401]ANT65125.1 hypothetical protein Ptc2401_01359 [Prosthecochloris sp. CIB 2401]